ncbi:MAG: carboxypeptidase-like regulatory domain-containing protein [Pricia sp.]
MKTFFAITGLLLSMVTYAQLHDSSASHGAISGTVTDMEMNGEPLLFANIALKGTPWNTRTNLNGNFEITEIVPGDYILVISFPGYETLEIPVDVAGNQIVQVSKALNAKSIDVGALLQAEHISKSKIPVLLSSRSK